MRAIPAIYVMNVQLLEKVCEAILKEPGQFIMADWFEEGLWFLNCGTAACIAG